MSRVTCGYDPAAVSMAGLAVDSRLSPPASVTRAGFTSRYPLEGMSPPVPAHTMLPCQCRLVPVSMLTSAPEPPPTRMLLANVQSSGPYSWLPQPRSEEHTSELQSRPHLVCRLLLEKKKNVTIEIYDEYKIKKTKV